MNATFMLVPLNAAERRKIKRRVSMVQPVVFVEPSNSTRKRTEAKAASEQVSNGKKNKGLSSKEPVVFLDELASTETPQVNFTFGSSSIQKPPVVSGQGSASKSEQAKVASPSAQKTMKKQKDSVLSGQCSASRKEEAKGASQPSAIQSRMKKVPKQRERKGKAPSKESATLPRGAQDKQIKPKEVISLVKTTLEKLTAETFHDLMKQLQDLTMDTEERLNSVVNLIFEKAMSRPDSSVLYANMCRFLTKMQVPAKDAPKLPGSFQTLLIRRCQAEFQNNHGRDDTCEERQSRDEGEHEQLRTEQYDANASRRSVSNIKFIAELFRLKMLSEAAVHSCIQTLLNKQDGESLECLCHLLNNIGKELELLTAKRVMDRYFKKVADIVKEGKMSATVSHLLKDLADLRQRNWLPETMEIDEIFMEDERPDTTSLSALQPSGHCTVPQSSADSSSAHQLIQGTEESHQCECHDNREPEAKKEETRQTLSISPAKLPLTEDDMEDFSETIIHEYLRTGDLKEAVHIISHLNSPSVLHVFVRNAVDLTLESGSRTRRKAGLLLLELFRSGVLHTKQFFEGLKDILEVTDYIFADVPEVWLCLAEILSPVLHEGGVSMAELFGKIKTLVPLGPAGVLLAHILTMLSSSITQRTIKVMWNNAGIKWEDVLHSSDDVKMFKADWMLGYTEGDDLWR
eukprot:superscaffoldBa00004067_g18206